MEFQNVVQRRRSVRRYDLTRPVPPEVIERIVGNGLRAPSAGFSQGWGFLVLDGPGDVARFRDAVRPESDPGTGYGGGVVTEGGHGLGAGELDHEPAEK